MANKLQLLTDSWLKLRKCDRIKVPARRSRNGIWHLKWTAQNFKHLHLFNVQKVIVYAEAW